LAAFTAGATALNRRAMAIIYLQFISSWRIYKIKIGRCLFVGKKVFEIPSDKIADYCRRWKITELALFGSALRDDFNPESDIDVLVTFDREAHWTLFDMVDMQEELKEIFGRDVDLVSRRGIESSQNYLRRKEILSSAKVIHVSR